ncbi:hypothetical protein HMPREF1581_00597, partial [Gardnerella vaginalis JCP8108]
LNLLTIALAKPCYTKPKTQQLECTHSRYQKKRYSNSARFVKERH